MTRSEAFALKPEQCVILDGDQHCTVKQTIDGCHSVLIQRADGSSQWVYCGRLSHPINEESA